MLLQAGSEYAIRALVELAHTGNGHATPLHQIAARCQISEDYLYKIFHELSRKGILKAAPGPKHGYTLTKKPEEISLLEIVQSVQGNLSSFCCVEKPDCCCPENIAPTCPTRKIFGELSDAIRQILVSHTLNELL